MPKARSGRQYDSRARVYTTSYELVAIKQLVVRFSKINYRIRGHNPLCLWCLQTSALMLRSLYFQPLSVGFIISLYGIIYYMSLHICPQPPHHYLTVLPYLLMECGWAPVSISKTCPGTFGRRYFHSPLLPPRKEPKFSPSHPSLFTLNRILATTNITNHLFDVKKRWKGQWTLL